MREFGVMYISCALNLKPSPRRNHVSKSFYNAITPQTLVSNYSICYI